MSNVKMRPRFLREIRRLLRITPSARGLAMLLAALSLAGSGLSLLFAHAMRLGISGATTGDWKTAWFGFHLLIIAAVARLVFQLVQPYLASLFRNRTVKAIRERLFAKLQLLPMGYVNKRFSGDVGQVLYGDCPTAAGVAVDSLTRLLSTPVTGLATLVYLGTTISWPLTLLATALAMTTFLGPKLFGKRLANLSREAREADARLSSFVRDILGSLEVAKAYNLSGYVNARLANLSGECLTLGRRVEMTRQQENILQSGVAHSFTKFTVLTVAAWMAFQGQIDAGAVAAYILLSDQVFWPFHAASRILVSIREGTGSLERVFEVLDAPGESPDIVSQDKPSRAANATAPVIRFSQVTFGYEPDKPVLRSLDCHLPAGTVQAFTGPTGVGKSSLFYALLRLYPITSGTICIDDQDIAHLKPDELRSLFAIVTQDCYLFDASIMDNIRWARQDATDAEVIKAAVSARVDAFIRALPDGYATLVGQRGSRLSGGERQRVSIARAILRDAPILLLDEATSSLDLATEREVQEALGTLIKGRTTLVITHRLETLRHADNIHVLENGVVTAQGRDDQLIETSDFYRQLREHQDLGAKA